MFGLPTPYSHLEPWDVDFNAAVMALANHACPLGWDVVQNEDDAPRSLHDLNAELGHGYEPREGGRIRVWAGASDKTIFGCPEHNYAFRAWHDALHWRHQLPFTFAGEAAVAYVQVFQLVRKCGNDTQVQQWVSWLLTEVMGQAMFYHLHNRFPDDQRYFVDKGEKVYRPLAKRLCDRFEDSLGALPMSEVHAISMARAVYG